MQKGFNSDINVEGVNYHVQTEDWGLDNPFLVSRVFRNGAVVKSVKTPYASILRQSPAIIEQAVRSALREQHNKILDLLVSGKLIPRC